MLDFEKARTWLGLTQIEAAQMLGVSQRTVSRWENNGILKTSKEQMYLQSMYIKVASQKGAGLTFSDQTVRLIDKDGESIYHLENESEMILLSIRLREL